MDLSRRHALVALGVALAAPLACRRKRRAQAVAGALATRNAIGRSGAYHLPPGYAGTSLPLLVLIHGTGSDGASTLAGFAESANARRFLVVAPDSRRSLDGLGSQHPRGWISTGRDDGLRTPDAQGRHASALRFAGLDVTERVFAGGHGLPEDERTAFLDWWLVG